MNITVNEEGYVRITLDTNRPIIVRLTPQDAVDLGFALIKFGMQAGMDRIAPIIAKASDVLGRLARPA